MFIVTIEDDYDTSHYGPFRTTDEAGNWCVTSFAKENDQVFIRDRDVVMKMPNPYYRPDDESTKPEFFERVIGKIVSLTKKRGVHIFRDGH